jgi:hypothetical protein
MLRPRDTVELLNTSIQNQPEHLFTINRSFLPPRRLSITWILPSMESGSTEALKQANTGKR